MCCSLVHLTNPLTRLSMKNLKSACLLALIAAAVAVPAYAQNLAIVNGKAIPMSRVDSMVKQMVQQGQKDSPEMRSMIKDELINREVLAQEADRLGIALRPEIKSQIDIMRQSIVIRAMFQEYIGKHPVTDAEMKAEYDKVKGEAKPQGKEYLARHILVDKEDEAKAIIAKLKGGAKFEELAVQSKDQGSAKQGGALDWATPDMFVKPFSDAMVALKPGEVTQTPVQTQFGYHVIRLEEMRDAPMPNFDDVKAQIAEMLQQRKAQQFQQDLRKKAKIQ